VVDGCGIGPEVACEHREESDATPVGERAVRVGDRRDISALRCRVVALEQASDDVADALRVAVFEIGADLERDRLTAATRAAAPELVEEATGWHSATIVHPPCAMH
jgi:hypothetical protein